MLQILTHEKAVGDGAFVGRTGDCNKRLWDYINYILLGKDYTFHEEKVADGEMKAT